jgi:hypothetical protein
MARICPLAEGETLELPPPIRDLIHLPAFVIDSGMRMFRRLCRGWSFLINVRFPAAHVREVIVGEQVVAAHGSREMPIWGPIFHQVEGDQDWGNVRLENLVKYLASIQSIQAANSSSGVELYKPH